MKNILKYILACAISLIEASAFAQFEWTGAVSSDWNGAGNWTEDGKPTSGVPSQWATVVFSQSGTITVNIPSGTLFASDTMKISGGGTVMFAGSGEIRLHHFEASSSIAVFDVPVKLYANNLHNWKFEKMNIEFKKPVESAGTTESSFNITNTDASPTDGHSIVFRDVLYAPTFNLNAVLGWAGDSQDKVRIDFYGKTTLKSFTVGNNYKSGYFHFYAAGNDISALYTTYGQVFFHAEDPLSEMASLAWNDYWNDSVIPGRYDFAAHATVGGIATTAKTSGSKRQITASSPMTLTLKALSTASTTAILGSNLSFVYAPNDSSFVQTFEANESQIDGKVTVEGGTLRLGTTAKFPALAALEVKSGAMFELAGTVSGALASLRTLTVDGTFKVGPDAPNAVPNTCVAVISKGGVIDTSVDIALAGLTYEGNSVPFGTYEGADWKIGSGKVTVLPSGGVEATYRWTGKAGNGSFGDSENWDSSPVFDSTRTTFVIPQAEATICVDRKVIAKRLSFTSAAAGMVTLNATVGSGLTLCEGSVDCAAAASVRKSVVINVPIEFIASLGIANGSESDVKTASNELRFTGRISSIGSGTINRSGYGTVFVTGDDNQVWGDITASQGETVVAGENPLGGSGTLLINRIQKLSRLTLDNAIVNRDVRSVRDDSSSTDEPFIWVKGGVDNVINGKITNKGGHARIWVDDNAKLECKGGMDLTESMWVCYQYNKDANQTLVVSGAPLKNHNWFYGDLAGSRLVLNVAGNYVGAAPNGKWYYAGTIETGVDNALTDNQTVEMVGVGVPVLDLKSTVQAFASLSRAVSVDDSGVFTAASKNGYVTGTVGSSLKLTGAADAVELPPFVGEAAFENAGTATRTMRRASSSSGVLTVSGGTLVLAAPGESYNGVAQSATDFNGGAWTNGSVMVTGGTLRLNHQKALGKKQVLTLTGGTVEIPSGVTVTVGRLVVNGKEMDIGTYRTGSFGGLVSGGGAIYCRGMNPGLMLLLR